MRTTSADRRAELRRRRERLRDRLARLLVRVAGEQHHALRHRRRSAHRDVRADPHRPRVAREPLELRSVPHRSPRHAPILASRTRRYDRSSLDDGSDGDHRSPRPARAPLRPRRRALPLRPAPPRSRSSSCCSASRPSPSCSRSSCRRTPSRRTSASRPPATPPPSRPSSTTTASTSRCRSATCSTSTTCSTATSASRRSRTPPSRHDLGTFIPATAELALYSVLFAAFVGVALRRDRGAAAQPADRPRPARHLARRHLDADVLDRARRALRRLLQAQLVPRRRPARPGRRPAAERHRALHDRRAARRQPRPLRDVAPPHHPAGARARGLQRQPADALHALGRARGDRQRLRARRPARRACPDASSSALHPARGAAVGDHGARARLRERAHRRGARREDLLLARDRPVRLPGRRQPRRARDRRRQHVRRGRLRDRQLRRRRPVRASSTRGSGSRDARPPSPSRRAAQALHDLRRLAAAARDHRRRDRRRLDPDRDLRAADRAARPARAERRAGAEPVLVVPLRHRRARPRRLQPRHLRLARLAADRAHARLRSRW